MNTPILRALTVATSAFAALALLALMPLPAQAEGGGGWDESGFVAARLLPQGLALSGTLGYGQLLWGQNGGTNVLFGFVRPSATLQTSILVNHADLAVDLFPVSFAGIRAGVAGSQRAVDLDTLDCTMVDCKGLLGSAYLKPELLLGYGPFAAMLAMRAAWYVSSNSAMPFGEEQNSLAGLAGNDQMISTEIAVQARITEQFSAGTFLSAAHMLGSGSTNQLLSLFGKYSRGTFTYMAGAGTYQSTTQSSAFTCYAVIGWTRLPSIGLF